MKQTFISNKFQNFYKKRNNCIWTVKIKINSPKGIRFIQSNEQPCENEGMKE